MLPWTKNNNLNLFYDDINQNLNINTIFNKMVENDIYLENKITSILSGDLRELRIATREETMAVETVEKAISPSTLMTLSATSGNMFTDRSTDRFITPSLYTPYINAKNPKTIFIDLSFYGVFTGNGALPTSTEILEKVDIELGSASPPDGTLLYVWFIYTLHWKQKYGRKLGGGYYVRHHYLDFMYQYTYKMTSGSWSYLRSRALSIRDGRQTFTRI